MKAFAKVVLGLAVMGAMVAIAAEWISVSDLLKETDKHDNKVVTVTGEVDEFRQRTARSGNEYYTFKLVTGDDEANVYGRGKLENPPKNGEKVEVIGLFRKEKKVQDFTVKNEIDVSKNDRDRKTKDFGVKVLKDDKKEDKQDK
jgi:hypothetical protein